MLSVSFLRTTMKNRNRLLHQILSQRPDLAKLAVPEFRSKGDRFALTDLAALWKILVEATQGHGSGNTICILDGLDECEERSRDVLVSKLVKWYKSRQSQNTKGGHFEVRRRKSSLSCD